MKLLTRIRSRSQRATTDNAPPGPPHQQLPIARYDHLTTKQISSELSGLSQIELGELEAYERAHSDRKPVLDKLRYMRSPEPLPGYDTLAQRDVIRPAPRRRHGQDPSDPRLRTQVPPPPRGDERRRKSPPQRRRQPQRARPPRRKGATHPNRYRGPHQPPGLTEPQRRHSEAAPALVHTPLDRPAEASRRSSRESPGASQPQKPLDSGDSAAGYDNTEVAHAATYMAIWQRNRAACALSGSRYGSRSGCDLWRRPAGLGSWRGV